MEEWKETERYPGYEVSNLGHVRNIRTKALALTKLTKNGGYLKCYLNIDGKLKTPEIHRLVAETFLSNEYRPGYVVDHINRDRTDNRVGNLRWVSKSENSKNRRKTEYNKILVTEPSGRVIIFGNAQQVADTYGFARQAVAVALEPSNKIKSVNGYEIHGVREIVDYKQLNLNIQL